MMGKNNHDYTYDYAEIERTRLISEISHARTDLNVSGAAREGMGGRVLRSYPNNQFFEIFLNLK